MDWSPDFVVVEPLRLGTDEEAAFAALWANHQATGDRGWTDYDLPHPKHRFLRWLAESRGFLLHGSGDPTIEEFAPRTQTDAAQNSVHAVFAASDGVWPMYFAIVNRALGRGSLRNGCRYTPTAACRSSGGRNWSPAWSPASRYELGARPATSLFGDHPRAFA